MYEYIYLFKYIQEQEDKERGKWGHKMTEEITRLQMRMCIWSK